MEQISPLWKQNNVLSCANQGADKQSSCTHLVSGKAGCVFPEGSFGELQGFVHQELFLCLRGAAKLSYVT